jgi:hypothetical protein
MNIEDDMKLSAFEARCRDAILLNADGEGQMENVGGRCGGFIEIVDFFSTD